jgi:hypothetical protein
VASVPSRGWGHGEAGARLVQRGRADRADSVPRFLAFHTASAIGLLNGGAGFWTARGQAGEVKARRREGRLSRKIHGAEETGETK